MRIARRIAPRRSAAGLISLLLASAFITSCGGGASPKKASPVAAPVPTTTDPTGAGTARAHRARANKHPTKRTSDRRAVSRGDTAKQVVASILTRAGLHVVSETVSSDGTSVGVSVDSTGACEANESQIIPQIHGLLPHLRSVAITVANTGHSLDQYQAGHCGSGTVPGGSGRVVLTLRGSGFASTKSFTIHSSAWTISYVDNGGALSIFPLKGQTPIAGAVVARPHSSGEKIEHGTGRYQLRISALGSWTVQVRDGS